MFKRLAKIAIAFVMVSTATTGIAIVESGASASASTYYCGNTCNNRSPNWVNPAINQSCAASAVLVNQASMTPAGANGVADPYMKVQSYYSTKCQTFWAKITNTKATGRSACSAQVTNAQYYLAKFPCPAAGTSSTSNMTNDHSPTNGVYAATTVLETTGGRNSEYFFRY